MPRQISKTRKLKRIGTRIRKHQIGGATVPSNVKHYKFTPTQVNTKDLFNKAIAYCSDQRPICQSIIELLNTIYPDTDKEHKNFKLDASLTDPFLQSTIQDPNYYNSWYRAKLGISPDSKEEFKFMSDPSLVDTLKIPEFATLIAQIARDCLIMLSTSKRNLDNQYRLGNEKISNKQKELIASKTKLESEISANETFIVSMSTSKSTALNSNKVLYNTAIQRTKKTKQSKKKLVNHITNELSILTGYNDSTKTNNNKIEKLSKPINNISTEIETLLIEINTCIQNGFIYSHILRIIIKFILLLSREYNKDEEDKLYNEWINTPFIFFPSYMSINFQTVVALISAPIVNFRISNRSRAVHGRYNTPMYDVSHDINAHAAKTHKFNVFGIAVKISFINYFTTMNELLKLLFPYYYCTDCTKGPDETKYEKKDLTSLLIYLDLSEQNKKNVMSLLLFTILHEMIGSGNSFKEYIYNFDESKKKKIVLELQREVSNNMFDKKYPFVKKLDWTSVVEAFSGLIADLNTDGNKYNILVTQLPDV